VLLFFSFVLIYTLYSFYIHEYTHLAVCLLTGNKGQIIIGFPAKTPCEWVFTPSVFIFWAYCLAPYLFLALPIVLFFSAVKLKIKNKVLNIFLFFILLIAILDTIINFLTSPFPNNDFYNILTISPWPFFACFLVVLYITFISRFCFKNFWPVFKKIIQEKIKDNG